MAIGSLIWRLADNSKLRLPAARFVVGKPPAQSAPLESRLATQFLALNRTSLGLLEIDARTEPTHDGHVDVVLSASGRIGAVPLRSPVSGEIEQGLLVSPRFGWSGVGSMLVGTGARILPTLPALPLLPRSALAVPAWVLAAVVLARLEALLDQTKRQFHRMSQLGRAPHGQVDWGIYVSRHLAVGHPERVPCNFSVLQADASLLGAAHATVLKQMAALTAVQSHALITRRLVERFERLRRVLHDIPPRWEGLDHDGEIWHSEPAKAAIQAMRWTHEDRGLAGLSPAAGLSWWLPMEQVFEAWVEAVVHEASRLAGGTVGAGRLKQTLRPLGWSPPYVGSQRFLLPDLEWSREDELIIFDAKYKSHWEELDDAPWHAMRETVRDSHRNDLLQVLAYAAGRQPSRVCCVLVYPCRQSTWESLGQRQRRWHVAEVPAGERNLRLILLALPLAGEASELASIVVQAIVGT